MLVAKLDGKIIYSHSPEAKDKNCICPGCNEKLIYKNGQIRRAHFAHTSNSYCVYYEYSVNESEEHREYKSQIFTWLCAQQQFESCFMEHKIGNRIADIYFERNGKKYVIELQCSKITLEKLIERTCDYNRLGIRVMWLWDSKFIKKSIRKNSIFDIISQKERYTLFYRTGNKIYLGKRSEDDKEVIKYNSKTEEYYSSLDTYYYYSLEKLQGCNICHYKCVYPLNDQQVELSFWRFSNKKKSPLRN